MKSFKRTVDAGFVPEFKDRTYFGIYGLTSWHLNGGEIEPLFDLVGTISSYLNKG
jgi:hypothetical protein